MPIAIGLLFITEATGGLEISISTQFKISKIGTFPSYKEKWQSLNVLGMKSDFKPLREHPHTYLYVVIRSNLGVLR